MKILAATTFLFCSLLTSRSTEAVEPRPSILDDDPKTLLFEVIAKKPTYLYGGSHNTAARIRSYLLDTPMEYLKVSDFVFCEVSYQDINEFHTAVQQHEQGTLTGDNGTEQRIVAYRLRCFFPNGEDLFSHCDEGLREKIEAFYSLHGKERRLKRVLERRIKPLLIAVADLHNIMPEEPTFVADHAFMNIALECGIPVKSLDDYPQLQIKMGSLGLKHQLEYLEYLLELRSMNDDRHFKDIIEACGSGNINHVFELFEAIVLPKGGHSAWREGLARELWVRRNNSWIEKLTPYVGKSTNFVVVGVTHLGGSNGLIRLFEEKGYKVRPIEMNSDAKASRPRQDNP